VVLISTLLKSGGCCAGAELTAAKASRAAMRNSRGVLAFLIGGFNLCWWENEAYRQAGGFDMPERHMHLPILTPTREISMQLIHNKTHSALSLIIAIPFILLAGSAVAKDVSVNLTGSEETPPVTTSATGAGKISIAKDHTVTGSIKTTGIEGVAAHIHVGAPGQSGPPIITLTKSEDGKWTVPEGSKLTDEQFASFTSGNLYVNVHSAEHKSGEIRGQLKP
jgi:hypothetical protein